MMRTVIPTMRPMGISDHIAQLAADIRKLLRARLGARLVSLFLGLLPVPASRPRVTRFGGVYYGAPYKRFYDAAQEMLAGPIGTPGDTNTEKPVVWIGEFIVEKPKTGKLAYPRGDVDNYAKGPMDAMTKVADRFWKDDGQVVGMIAFKRYARPGEPAGINMDYCEVPT